jgi:hypothetical protein
MKARPKQPPTPPPPPEETDAIKCPDCGCSDTRVFKTRRTIGGRIRRTRECRNCGRHFSTFEARSWITKGH